MSLIIDGRMVLVLDGLNVVDGPLLHVSIMYVRSTQGVRYFCS
ncbi:hypothetical protein [Levilactobacillus yonginensis]